MSLFSTSSLLCGVDWIFMNHIGIILKLRILNIYWKSIKFIWRFKTVWMRVLCLLGDFFGIYSQILNWKFQKLLIKWKKFNFWYQKLSFVQIFQLNCLTIILKAAKTIFLTLIIHPLKIQSNPNQNLQNKFFT